MKTALFLTCVGLIGVFFVASYVLALRDNYIEKASETPSVFMWQRDFWCPEATTGRSITRLELPSVLISYWTRGRRQLRDHRRFFSRNIAGEPWSEELKDVIDAERASRMADPDWR